ncbi:hypothetical protein Avbf_09296 [Armadillidium vulgare]|nr:hypothetical protein Avbf_09296 [Armadillidium vulgare]
MVSVYLNPKLVAPSTNCCKHIGSKTLYALQTTFSQKRCLCTCNILLYNLFQLGQYIKFLLEYTGEEYIDKIYEFGPEPDNYFSQWLKEKFELGLDFPNLPYY